MSAPLLPLGDRSGRGLWVTGLITFLADEGWVVPKLQCTYKSVFRMQAIRSCPGGIWLGRCGGGAPAGLASPGPSLVPDDSLLEERV